MATIAETPVHVLARKVWGAFAFTFVISRILVFLSMSGRMPDIHPQLGGTRLHHLNYGIFLLAGVGAALLFSRPTGRWLSATAILYGVALALTFDEFGMWLHLDTDYWQRVSFDAVVVVGALLGLVATSPALRQFRPRHWATAIALIATLALFGIVLLRSPSVRPSPDSGALRPEALARAATGDGASDSRGRRCAAPRRPGPSARPR